jgi:hypothetical protein
MTKLGEHAVHVQQENTTMCMVQNLTNNARTAQPAVMGQWLEPKDWKLVLSVSQESME